MTKNNSFKKQIRARMKATGETYAQAREALYEKTFPLDHLLTNGLSLPLDKAVQEVTAEDLFAGQELQTIRNSLMNDHNIVVLGGANTGKTFTLNALLNSNFALNPTHRLVTIEEYVNELQVSEYTHVSLLSGLCRPRIGVLDLVPPAKSMNPNAIAVGEIRIDEISSTEYMTMRGISAFTTCHSRNIIQLAGFLGGDFPAGTTLVMVDRLKIGEHTMLLRAVVPLTEEVKEAMELYHTGGDEQKLHETLDALGVVTIDAKRQKLTDLGILK